MLDKVEAELVAFKGCVAKNPAFGKFLANPTLSRKEKVAMVNNFFYIVQKYY